MKLGSVLRMSGLSALTSCTNDVEPRLAPYTGTTDALFATIEKMHMKFRPVEDWGKFCDAGTGAHSLAWVQQLPLESWTAVTADKKMQSTVEEEAAREASGKRPENTAGNIVLGNWDDEDLLADEQFDVILADYLIGAMDGFSPFKQDLIFDRLKRHLAPTKGIIYIIGLEPIPYNASHPEDIIVDVTRARDACILLAGQRCYREYPFTWVQRQLQKHGYRILGTEKLPILYSEQSIRRQLNVAKSKLPYFKDRILAKAMARRLAELDSRMVNVVAAQKPNSRIRHGFDYIIAAEVDPTFQTHT